MELFKSDIFMEFFQTFCENLFVKMIFGESYWWILINYWKSIIEKKKRHYQLKTLIKGFDASSKSLVIGFVSKMLPVGGKNVAND